MHLYLSASDIAKHFNVHRSTVTRWLRKGLIKGVERPRGAKKWRIPITSFQEFVKSH